MASLAKLPKKLTAPGSKAKAMRRPNAVRQIMEREQRVRENSAAAARASSVSAMSGPARATGSGLQCPNKACPNPNVVDGTCQTCGRVADDSNIVSEIQFGENSSGAAVVQGSFLGADQGGVRTVGGPAFRRVAGSGAGEARERSLKEAKTLMQQYVHRLNLSPALAESGFRLYRMAAMNNFVQGRKITNVVAMCLYAACRKEQNCKIMLIDLADICKENVFKLGRNYKAFIAKFPEVKEGPNPIILEDLIWRFASKLEFYGDTNKVALSAVRIAHRMQKDHMTHGRRPAGICGAAIIMAARAHSYRRTVREVVYIAKVTTHTLQIRMDEFANVPSAQMTIDEFHTNDFLDEQYDPPWWYKQSAAYKEKHQRTNKRKVEEIEDGADATEEVAEGQNGEKRQKTMTPEASQSTSSSDSAGPAQITAFATPSPSPAPTPQPSTATDKDGFVIPPLPEKAVGDVTRVVDRVAIASARGGDGQLDLLAREFGDVEDVVPERSTEAAMAAAMGIDFPAGKKTGRSPSISKAKSKGKGKAKDDSGPKLAYDEQWEADENALEEEMEVHLSDPQMILVARDEAQKEGDSQALKRLNDFAEERRVDEAIDKALHQTGAVPNLPGAAVGDAAAEEEPADDTPSDPRFTPRSKVSNDPIVSDKEFANDPEVICCLLTPEEAKIKEQLWTNENKDWMSSNQQKIFRKKMEARGPPKKTRKRIKTARIGEGQASPASSAGEAAVNALTMRAVSKKINYTAFQDIFDMRKYHRPGSEFGGTSTMGSNSRAGSVAPSEGGSEFGDDRVVGKAAVRVKSAESASKTPEAAAKVVDADNGNGGDEDDGVDLNVAEDEDEDQTAIYDQDDFQEEEEDIDPFANDDDDEWA